MENVKNFETTITFYIEVGFRYEVGHWITIKSIFKLAKLHEILTQSNFASSEKAITFEKWS